MAKPEPPPPQTIALAGRLRTELDQIDRLRRKLGDPPVTTTPGVGSRIAEH